MTSLIIQTGAKGKDYSGNFVVGHTHLMDISQFVMMYEGPISDSIRYYRTQKNEVQSGIVAARSPITWYIGQLPIGIPFEENEMILLVHLDIVFPKPGIRSLADLECLVAEAGTKPSAEQPQSQQ